MWASDSGKASAQIFTRELKRGDLTMRIHRNCLCILAVVLLCVGNFPALAEDGVSKDKILFGQVAALSGPAQALGQGMREGILAAFDEANRAGGVNGRTLALKSVDDGYEPEQTIVAIKKLIAEDKVFALL